MGRTKFTDVVTSELVFNKKLSDQGNATVFYPNGESGFQKLLITTPKMKCSVTDNSVYFTVSDEGKDFLNLLIDLDDKIEEKALEYKSNWFSDELTDEDVKDRYKGSIKNSKNKGTLFCVSKSKNLKIYDKNKTVLEETELQKEDLCVGLVELDCVLMGKNTFKNSFKLHHLKVMKEVSREVEIVGTSFDDSDEQNIEIED